MSLKKLIWRDIEISVPSDWELLQFARDRERGRCALADRYQFRLELDWCEVEREPDLARLMSDYKSKLEKDKELEDGSTAKIAGYFGLTGKDSRCSFSRFGAYFDAGKCLVEIVFLWPDNRDKALEKQVLESLRYRKVSENDIYRTWQAFDMSIQVPVAYAPSSLNVKPAMTEWRFEGPKKPQRLRYLRIGMLDSWLKAPLTEWLKGQTGPFVFNKKTDEKVINGQKVACLSGRYRPKGVVHRNGAYQSLCWIDPTDNRLYMLEDVSLKDKTPPLKELFDRLRSAAG